MRANPVRDKHLRLNDDKLGRLKGVPGAAPERQAGSPSKGQQEIASCQAIGKAMAFILAKHETPNMLGK